MIEGVTFIGLSSSKENNTFFHAPAPEKNDSLPEKFYIADENELYKVVEQLEAQLTITLNETNEELSHYDSLISNCREKSGRIIMNGVPTGVEVCPSMQHGDPFQASTDSKFTSVGTAAIFRFVRPVTFQDCPEKLLPEELNTENPFDIYRLGEWEI